MRRLSAAVAAFSLPLTALTLMNVGAAHAATPASIQITEIAYGGKAAPAAGGDGEYAELTNVGGTAQDLTGWHYLTTEPGKTTGAVDLSPLGTLAPGESVLLTDMQPADFRTEWGLKANVKVLNDGTSKLDSAADTITVSDNTGAVADSLGWAAGFLPAKGAAAFVNAGHLGDTTAAAGGWTVPATVGDGEGSWAAASSTAAALVVGSPGVSTLGTAVDSTRTPATVRETGQTGSTPGADLQITELAYGGLASSTHAYAGDTGDGEYIELTNVGYAAQDMTGWKYATSQATPPAVPSTPATGVLDLSAFGTVAPGESVIITDLNAADFRTEWSLKANVKVVSDKQAVATAATINAGNDALALFNASGTLVESLSYANGFFSGKGVGAFVNAGQLSAVDTATAGAWTVPATVGDAEGSWISAASAIGSPGASTQGTATPASVRTSTSTALALAGANPQSATVNTAFSYTGLTASGGTAPYMWSATGLTGTGLAIDSSTGAITGTPTSAGVINVTATVTDHVGATASAPFTITVAGTVDPNWSNIVINEITSDNEDNPELTGHLPAALYAALNTSPNIARDLVEIFNKGSQAVNILGWKQADSGGLGAATDFSNRVFDLAGNPITTIPAHGYGVFQSGKGLSSGGDAVSIYLPNGTQVDSVTFDGSQAGYDAAYDPTAAGPNPTTEVYHTLARCPDGSGDVNIGSNANGTPWHSVKVASFGSSNNASCDTSTDPDAAVTKYNQQPPTGLPSTCMPSAPSGSDSVTVPGSVAWPTSDIATPVDNLCEFITPQDPTGNDISGLDFSSDGSVLWAVQNKNHLWKLVKDNTGKYVASADDNWSGGKGLTFTGTDPSASEVDSEGLTIGGNGHIFTTSERDNVASNVSKDEVLEYDQTDTATTLAPVHQWNLTADFVPSLIAATGEDANLGFEGVTYVPDPFLTGHGFRDQHLSKTYNPADYPAHGGGLFFVAMEKNGHVYAYSLNDDGSFQRVADIDTGVDGTSAIADVQFNADDQGLWAHCDNDCGVADSLLKIDGSGNFSRVASYRRPAGLPDDNFEGFAIAPASTAVNGKREVVWSDDGIYGGGNAWNADKTANVPSVGWGHALFAGTIPVSVAPSALTGTVPTTATVGTAYTSPALTPTGGFPAVFSYSVSTGTLPAGLTLNPSTGAITGTPTAGGVSTFTLAVTNGVGTPATLPATITVSVPDTTPPTVSVGGIVSGTTYKSPPTPTCVASDAGSGVATCVLQDVATGAHHTVTATATDKAGNKATATATYNLVPPVTVPPVKGRPKVGQTLSVTITLPSGATATYQWFAGKKAIKHATKSRLKLTKKLRHAKIRLRVTVTVPGEAPVTTILKVSTPVR